MESAVIVAIFIAAAIILTFSLQTLNVFNATNSTTPSTSLQTTSVANVINSTTTSTRTNTVFPPSSTSTSAGTTSSINSTTSSVPSTQSTSITSSSQPTSSIQTTSSTPTTTAQTLISSDCTTPTDPNYVLQYSTQYWDVYAYNSTWNAYKGNYIAQINYLDEVYSALSQMLNVDIVSHTTSHKLYLVIWQQTGGGVSTGCISEIGHGPGIMISYDAWTNPYAGGDNWSIELIAHETTNVFTGYIVSGWPRDWWADDISPFPYAMKILVEEQTGHYAAAQLSQASADALSQMFLNLKATYGANIYATMLSDLTADGWSSWFGPNPSPLLSDYVAAYLSEAAGTDLTNTINNAFASKGGFSYTINDSIVKDIMAKRNELQYYPTSSGCWQQFRSGNYNTNVC